MNTKSILLFIVKLTTDYKTTKYCNKFPAFYAQKIVTFKLDALTTQPATTPDTI